MIGDSVFDKEIHSVPVSAPKLLRNTPYLLDLYKEARNFYVSS